MADYSHMRYDPDLLWSSGALEALARRHQFLDQQRLNNLSQALASYTITRSEENLKFEMKVIGSCGIFGDEPDDGSAANEPEPDLIAYTDSAHTKCDPCNGAGFLRSGEFPYAFGKCVTCDGAGQKYLKPPPEPVAAKPRPTPDPVKF